MERDFEQPATQKVPEGGYFAVLPYLQYLQNQVSIQVGPSAGDVLKDLEREAVIGGVNPIVANCQGETPDEYLQAFPEILRLEEILISKITPHNVSEVFQLIRETEYYKPTHQVTQAIRGVYLGQLNSATSAS